MALIICPKCGKEISDRARVCPGCGSELFNGATEETKQRICEDCGAVLEEDATACPICGCPVEVKEKSVEVEECETSRQEEPKAYNRGKIIKTVVSLGIIAIIVVAGLIVFFSIQKKKAVQEYYSYYASAVSIMIDSASDAESAGNLIKSVWYNSIYEKSDSKTDKYTKNYGYFYDDFNTALGNLFSDPTFSVKIEMIKNNQDKVNTLMKKLNDPPEEYEDAYDALKEFYEAYLEFTNLVTDPSGSLSTFSSGFNAADSNTVNKYNKVKIYLE